MPSGAHKDRSMQEHLVAVLTRVTAGTGPIW